VIYTYDDCRPSNDQDNTENNPEKPALMGFVLAAKARQWVLSSVKERERNICIQYAKLFDVPDALQPVDYCDQNWMGEEWSGGCYVGTLPPRVLTHFTDNLREPLYKNNQERKPAVHFAGTETATRHAGYMDGAIQAGERAANTVQSCLSSQYPHIQKSVWVAEEPVDPSYDCQPLPIGPSAIEKVLPGVRGFIMICSVCIVFLAFLARKWLYS